MTAGSEVWHHNCHTIYASVGEGRHRIHNIHEGDVEIVVGRTVRRSAVERSVHIVIDVVHAVRGSGIVLSKEAAAAVAALW